MNGAKEVAVVAECISPYCLPRFPVLALRFASEGQRAFPYCGGRKSLLSLRDFASALFGFRLSPQEMFLQPFSGKFRT